MSYKSVKLISLAKIVHETVCVFEGEKYYMATGDLSNEKQKELELVSYVKRPSRADLIAKKGDVILARMKATNKVLLVKDVEAEYIYSTGFIILRPSNEIDNIFLLHFLQSSVFQDEKDKLCTGATQKAINNQNFSNLNVPLPPLPIQKCIAEILDAADALKRNDFELQKKYDELAEAIFIDMFGDPVKNERRWEMKKVIEYCQCIVPGRDKPKSFTGSIPWITTDDLNHLGITKLSKKSLGLTQNEIEEVKAKVIPANSVIMTCVGDLGIITINEIEIVVNQQLHAFQCGTIMNPYFLMHNLSQQKKFMYKMSSSTTVPYMNKTVCNSIPVICPPIKLQNLFSHKLELVRRQLISLKYNSAENLFQTLIQKAFKGELVK